MRLELRDISKAFAGVAAVDRLSLTACRIAARSTTSVPARVEAEPSQRSRAWRTSGDRSSVSATAPREGTMRASMC